MSDEPTTAQPEAEPPKEQAPTQEATPEVQPEPETTPEPDWQAAYKGLQTNLNRAQETAKRAAQRAEDVLRQNATLAETVEVLKKGQSAILKNTAGEEEAQRFEADFKSREERQAALQAAQTLETSLRTSISAMDGMMAAAGLSQEERVAVYAQAKDVDGPEWFGAVYQIAQAKIGDKISERERKAAEAIASRSRKEIEEEAEARTQRKLKESGIDKVDTASAGSATLAQRIAGMDPTSPEFAKIMQQAKTGTLRI